MRWTVGAALAGVVLALTGCTGGSKGKGPDVTPSGSPQALLDAAVAAAQAKGAVELKVVYTGGTKGTSTYDVGGGVGQQVIDLGVAHLEGRTVGGTYYFRANFRGMQAFSGLQPEQAAKVSDQWVIIDPKSSSFAALSRGLTIDGVLDEMRLTGTLAQPGRRNFDGQRVYAITGKDPKSTASQTVLISTATGLPVGFLETTRNGTTTGHFSAWGVTPALTAPTPAVPFAQALASPVPSPTPSAGASPGAGASPSAVAPSSSTSLPESPTVLGSAPASGSPTG